MILKPYFDKNVWDQGVRLRFDSLVGDQKAMMVFVFQQILRLCAPETNGISGPTLAAILDKSIAAAKNTAFELVKKGFLITTEYKTGRGGSSRYRIPSAIYEEMSQLNTLGKL